MSVEPIDILGGESVYCINQSQLQEAFNMALKDPVAGPRIQSELKRLEVDLNRNERAALAFVMIDRLLKMKK